MQELVNLKSLNLHAPGLEKQQKYFSKSQKKKEHAFFYQLLAHQHHPLTHKFKRKTKNN